MTRILDEVKIWLLSQCATLVAVLFLFLFYFFNLGFFKLDPLLTLTLSVLALAASQTLSSSRDKVVLAISLLLIALLPIFQATLGLALLIGLTYVLEDEKNSLYFFGLLIICLIEALPGFVGQVGAKGAGTDIYRALQLVVLYFLALKGVRPERAFIFVLLTLSSSLGKADGQILTLPLLSLITLLSSFKFGLNRSLIALGLSLSVCSHDIGLTLVSLLMVLAHNYLEKFPLKDDFKLVLPLFLVLALFKMAPLYGAIILIVLIVRIAITGRMKVCLSKSHL